MQQKIYCPVCFAEVVDEVKDCPICQTNFQEWKHRDTTLEQFLHNLKHPDFQVHDNSMKKLENQPSSPAVISLAKYALAYPDDIWQNCQIIKILKKIPPSTQKETAFKMLSTHPVKIIREAVAKIENHDDVNGIKIINLSILQPNIPARIKDIEIGVYGKSLINRFRAMGIITEKPVMVLRKSCFGGPIHLRVGANTELAIRREEAKTVIVESLI